MANNYFIQTVTRHTIHKHFALSIGSCEYIESAVEDRRQGVHRIVSAVTTAEFVSDRMSYIVLRGSSCNIIVFNVHAPIKENSDDSNDRFFMRN